MIYLCVLHLYYPRIYGCLHYRVIIPFDYKSTPESHATISIDYLLCSPDNYSDLLNRYFKHLITNVYKTLIIVDFIENK